MNHDPLIYKHITELLEDRPTATHDGVANKPISYQETWGFDDEKSEMISDRNHVLIEYILENSRSGGKFDCGSYLSNGDTFESSRLGIVKGVAYDLKDGGNFMWGQLMSRLVPYYIAKIGSELQGFLNGQSDNGQGSGISWLGDSAADQRAIWNGYYYDKSPKKVFTSGWF